MENTPGVALTDALRDLRRARAGMLASTQRLETTLRAKDENADPEAKYLACGIRDLETYANQAS